MFFLHRIPSRPRHLQTISKCQCQTIQNVHLPPCHILMLCPNCKTYFFQGILDVGMTQEDHVELIKTHTFMRKHATGTAKIELHVLHVERGRDP